MNLLIHFERLFSLFGLSSCILQIESNGHSLSYGRFDQYMYPYYIKDINERKSLKKKH